jgi:hypothetical protein
LEEGELNSLLPGGEYLLDYLGKASDSFLFAAFV